MNERALQDAYRLFQLKGYQGEIEDFVNLLNTNTNALSDSYTLFTRAGYTGTLEDFSTLLGLKKKDETQIIPEPVPEVVMDFPSQAGLSGLPKTKTSRRVPTQAQLDSEGSQESKAGEWAKKIPIVGKAIDWLFVDTIDDMATYVQQGLGQGATLNEALEVMARGSGSTKEDIADYIAAVKQMDNIEVTDEMRGFAKIYQEGGSTIGSFLWGLANYPTVTPGIILQSFANYVNPTALAGGAAGAGVGAGVGAALTPYVAGAGAIPGAGYGGIMGLTGTLESGLSFTEFLKEEVAKKGLEFNESGVAAVLNDEEALSRVRTRTAGRGATISVVNAFTLGIAGQVQRAGRKLTQAGRNLRRIGIEMTGGGVGEAAGRLVAGQEMDVAEIGFEAIGEIGSPEVVIPMLLQSNKTALEQSQQANKIAQYKINGEVVNKQNVEEVIQGGDLEALQNIDIEIINDPVLQADLMLAQQNAMIGANIKKVIPDISPEDLKKLVTLQTKLTLLEANNTQVAKDKIREIKLEIKLIEAKYAIQEPSTEKVDAQEPTPDGETVGEGDTQQQPITGETTSGPTQTTQQGEEVTTETETEEKIKSDLEKARAGDVEMQRKFEKYGIDWKYNPTYRFVGQSEVDALYNKETIKGKFEDGRVDVTISEEPSTGEDAQYRITYKEDVIDSGDPKNKMRMKNDVDGWIMGGYTLDDVSVIEKINPDGTLEVVYEADTTEVTTETETQVETETETEEITGSSRKQKLQPISDGIARQLIKSGEENKPPDPFDKEIQIDEDGNVVIDEVEEDNWYWMKRDSELGWLDIVIKNKEEVVSISIDGKEVDFFLKNKIENELIDEGVITPSEQTEEVTAPLIKIEPGTQTEQVTQLLEERGELSITEAANELGILEPNVRRIFGVGTKEGVFERVDKGVYTLTQGDKTYAVIEADAVDGINTLIQKKNEGKFDGVDAVYLDPPYEVKSKNRNIADFAAITPKEFDNVIKKLPSILKNEDSVVMLQYTQAKQPQNVKERKAYLDSLKKQGFKFALGISKTTEKPKKIVYKKMTQDMKKEQFMAGQNIKEDIFVLTRTGMLPENFDINFAEEGSNYVLSYPMVDIRAKKFKEFKGDTKKSVPAMEDLVETFVPEDGIILDPYVGVGTTISAAITKGREAIGIELDPKKAAKARRVIERKTKKTKPTQTKPEPKKTLQKEAPKKVKQTVPDKPVQEVAPGTHKIGNFDVVIKDNKIVSITKDGKEASTASRNKVVKELVNQGLINVDAGQDSPNVGEISNPRKLALTVQALEDKRVNIFQTISQMKESGIASLFGTKFTPKSIIGHFGLSSSEMGKGFMQTWVRTKEKGGKSMEDGFIDNNEQEFSKDEVGDFIQTYPSQRAFDDAMKTDIINQLKEAKERFTEITGLKPTPTNLQAVIDAPTQQELQERADIQEGKRVDEEQRQAEAQGFVEKKAPKEKPTPPKKTIKKPEVEPASPEVQEAMESITPLLDEVTAPNIIKNLENIPSIAKTYLRKPGGVTQGAKNVPLEKVRSTPGIYFDQALGINNSVAVYDNTIGRIARALGVYEGNFDKVAFEVSELEKKLGKLVIGDKTISKVSSIAGVDRMRNKQLEDALLIGLYMDVRQAELNQIAPGEFSETSPDPVVTLDMGIKRSAAPEARTLQKFKDKYVKDGKIKSDDILKDFSPTQRSVLKSLDKLNAKLEPLAIEVLKRDGKVLNPIKGYFHRLVLPEDSTAERVTIEKDATDFSDPSKRKFRSDALIERTEGNKPINYNPFISLLRGSQQMLLDYHVSPELDIVQDIAEELRAKYSKGNKGQKDATVALDLAIKENLRTLYLLTYMGANDMNLSKAFMAEVNRNMYRAMLSSGPRWASELAGNAMMFITQDPKIIKDAYTKYRSLTMNMKNRNKYKDVLLNLQSAEARKVAKRTRATNRALDVNDYLNLGQSNKQVMSGPVFEKIEQLLKFGPKQSYKAISKLADFLMAGADKLVTTPVWVSKFAFEFKKAVKKHNKEDIDVSLKEFDKIADGTSEFLGPKYKKARDEAVRRADRMVASFVTSGNPINAIIKNRRRTFGAATSRMDYYRHLNSFMANFNLNEYAGSRFAVGALLKSGYMSKPEAAKYLGGILARMSSYVILYRLLGNFMDELFGAPEEEEDPLEQQIARQLIGSSATLLFRGGIGNIWALPINYMIETLNKQYLEELRDGKPYDAFDNSIVYSLISLDVLNDRRGPLPTLARILAGRYAPIYQVGERSFELVNRMFNRKTDAARKRAAEELLDRMISIEVPGLLGLLPFYKDARRVWLKKKYGEGSAPSNTSSGFDPFRLKEKYRTK